MYAKSKRRPTPTLIPTISGVLFEWEGCFAGATDDVEAGGSEMKETAGVEVTVTEAPDVVGAAKRGELYGTDVAVETGEFISAECAAK